MPKFNKGDRVVILDSVFKKYLRTDAIILELDSPWGGQDWYKVELWDQSEMAFPEKDLQSYSEYYLSNNAEKKVDSGCTCGAKYTSNPKFHYDYCSESKKEEIDNWWNLLD